MLVEGTLLESSISLLLDYFIETESIEKEEE